MPSQESKQSRVYVLEVLVLPIFLRFCYIIWELFRPSDGLKKKIFFAFHFISIFPRKIFSNSRFLTHFLVTCSIYLVFNVTKWSEEYEYLDNKKCCFLVRGGFCCNIGNNNTDNVTIICNDYISDTQYIVTTSVSIGYVAPRSPRSSWLLIKILISNENGYYPFYVDVLSVLFHRQDSHRTWLYISVKCWCPIIHNP